MKTAILIILIGLIFTECKEKTDPYKTQIAPNITKNTTKEENKNFLLTVADSIANTYGYEYWKNISEIQFTFNVDRANTHLERSWIWKPKTQEVTLVTEVDTIRYQRNQIDSTQLETDQAFINDKFWLLAPFHLIWDKNTIIDKQTRTIAPISGNELNKITLTYGKEGGYTPGDAYDFFYDEHWIIKEWIFRKGNAEKPSIITTWEDPKIVNNIRFSTMYQNSEGSFKLYFTDIALKTL